MFTHSVLTQIAIPTIDVVCLILKSMHLVEVAVTAFYIYVKILPYLIFSYGL